MGVDVNRDRRPHVPLGVALAGAAWVSGASLRFVRQTSASTRPAGVQLSVLAHVNTPAPWSLLLNRFVQNLRVVAWHSTWTVPVFSILAGPVFGVGIMATRGPGRPPCTIRLLRALRRYRLAFGSAPLDSVVWNAAVSAILVLLSSLPPLT